MPIENKRPNKEQDIRDRISNFASNMGNTSFNGVEQLVNIANDAQLDGIGYLRKLTTDVDNPVFKNLANDLINILGSFYASEEVLCCLIKNLLITVKAGGAIDSAKKKIIDMEKQILDGKIEDSNLSVSDFDFVSTIDELIFIIDTIISFMQLEISDFVLPNLDFAKLISDTVVGMVVISMQEIVFTLRDASIAWIIDALSRRVGDNAWAKCLPFMDFTRILKRYVHDYGMLERLFNMISGVVGAKHAKMASYVENSFPRNVKEVEFLKWLRDILIKMKSASISWEFCVDLNFDASHDNEDISEGQQNLTDFLSQNNLKDITTGDPDNNIKTTLGDNNTILTNAEINQGQSQPDQVGIFAPPSDSEVNGFLTKHLGLSKDQADQLTGFTSRDNVQGTLSDNPTTTNNDCGYTLTRSDVDKTIREILKSQGII